MRAAVLEAPGEPLVIRDDLSIRNPRPGEDHTAPDPGTSVNAGRHPLR